MIAQAAPLTPFLAFTLFAELLKRNAKRTPSGHLPTKACTGCKMQTTRKADADGLTPRCGHCDDPLNA
jgi:hypothetical protein